LQVLVLGGEIDAVIVIARHHIGAAANHRGERLGAAFEINEFDLHAGLFVFAELLGKHGRQIAQTDGPADRNGDLCGCCAGCERQHSKRRTDASKQFRNHWAPPASGQDRGA
jgi:hypothetical protein